MPADRPSAYETILIDRVMRPVSYLWTVFGFGSTFVLLGTLAVVTAIDGSWPRATVLAVVAIWFGYLLYGAIRVGVYYNEDGLLLRQLVGVRRIRWADVKRISSASEDGREHVGIILVNGKRVRCHALGTTRHEPTADLDPYVVRLNWLLRQARARQAARAGDLGYKDQRQ